MFLYCKAQGRSALVRRMKGEAHEVIAPGMRFYKASTAKERVVEAFHQTRSFHPPCPSTPEAPLHLDPALVHRVNPPFCLCLTPTLPLYAGPTRPWASLHRLCLLIRISACARPLCSSSMGSLFWGHRVRMRARTTGLIGRHTVCGWGRDRIEHAVISRMCEVKGTTKGGGNSP